MKEVQVDFFSSDIALKALSLKKERIPTNFMQYIDIRENCIVMLPHLALVKVYKV